MLVNLLQTTFYCFDSPRTQTEREREREREGKKLDFVYEGAKSKKKNIQIIIVLTNWVTQFAVEQPYLIFVPLLIFLDLFLIP